MAACDACIPAHFVLDSLVSTHANTHDLLLWDARITLCNHSPDPNAKWHNRDIKASHLRPRRAASRRLRWRSTLVPLWWNVGHFCTSGPVNQLIWGLGSVGTLQLEETGTKQTRKWENNPPILDFCDTDISTSSKMTDILARENWRAVDYSCSLACCLKLTANSIVYLQMP